MRKC